jgi:hypothetical protein
VVAEREARMTWRAWLDAVFTKKLEGRPWWK